MQFDDLFEMRKLVGTKLKDSIQKDMIILADNFITDKDKKNFVIYKGQKLESAIAYILQDIFVLRNPWYLLDVHMKIILQ